MLRKIGDFCTKCGKGKILCACVVTASIAGSLFGFSKADPQVKLLPVHSIDSMLTTGVTGTAGQTFAIH
jgi:hypothetical protein